MNQFKPAVYGVVSVILLTSVFLAVNSNNAISNNSSDISSSARKHAELLETNLKQIELADLRDQFNKLMKQSNTQARTLDHLQQQVQKKPAGLAEVEKTRDLIDSSQEASDDMADQMDSEQLRHAEFEQAKLIISTLDDEMSSEEYDEAWAPGMQNTITITLEKENFEGTELLNVACQSSLCRIEVEHENSDAEDEFLHNFVPAAGYQDTEVYFAHSEGADGRSHMTYYVSRDGQQMPVLDGVY